MKRLIFFYQRACWYASITIQEVLKPLRLWNETLLVITFLAVKGINVDFLTIIIVYLIIMSLAVIGGKILVICGIVEYNQKIVNHQNRELMEILERVKNIEQKLK